MSEENKKPTETPLDTETTFADMNVEGFSWYDKNKKQGKQKVQVDKKEFWAMVKGAFSAYLPLIGVIACIGVIIYLVAYLWLGN